MRFAMYLALSASCGNPKNSMFFVISVQVTVKVLENPTIQTKSEFMAALRLVAAKTGLLAARCSGMQVSATKLHAACAQGKHVAKPSTCTWRMALKPQVHMFRGKQVG